jgi:hypothetical protein
MGSIPVSRRFFTIWHYMVSKLNGESTCSDSTREHHSQSKVDAEEKSALECGQWFDVLEYFKRKRLDQSASFQSLAGSGFDYLEPGLWMGSKRQFRVKCDGDWLTVEAFPFLVGAGGKQRLVRLPLTGQVSSAEFEYRPRAGFPPGFRLRVQPGNPVRFIIREQEANPTRTYAFVLSC